MLPFMKKEECLKADTSTLENYSQALSPNKETTYARMDFRIGIGQ
jgi:hypothetical protein